MVPDFYNTAKSRGSADAYYGFSYNPRKTAFLNGRYVTFYDLTEQEVADYSHAWHTEPERKGLLFDSGIRKIGRYGRDIIAWTVKGPTT